MTDADRIEALLNIVDETRAEVRGQSEKLVVLGYAERRGKNGFWPTNAGWNFLSDRGRPFDTNTWPLCTNSGHRRPIPKKTLERATRAPSTCDAE